MGHASPRNLHAQVSHDADLLKERVTKRYPGLPFVVDVALVSAGFAGMVIQTATMWAERQFSTPIDTLLDHNVYAWMGLHQWLKGQSTPG